MNQLPIQRIPMKKNHPTKHVFTKEKMEFLYTMQAQQFSILFYLDLKKIIQMTNNKQFGIKQCNFLLF